MPHHINHYVFQCIVPSLSFLQPSAPWENRWGYMILPASERQSVGSSHDGNSIHWQCAPHHPTDREGQTRRRGSGCVASHVGMYNFIRCLMGVVLHMQGTQVLSYSRILFTSFDATNCSRVARHADGFGQKLVKNWTIDRSLVPSWGFKRWRGRITV
jgi:hypothetical protein